MYDEMLGIFEVRAVRAKMLKGVGDDRWPDV